MFLYIDFPKLMCNLQGIMTILRDRTTSREDFIFFTDRLATLLVEKAMELLPHVVQEVITPVEAKYVGKKLEVNVSYHETPSISINSNDLEQLCGVSILRS